MPAPFLLLWHPRRILQGDIDFDLELVVAGLRFPYDAETRFDIQVEGTRFTYTVYRSYETMEGTEWKF